MNHLLAFSKLNSFKIFRQEFSETFLKLGLSFKTYYLPIIHLCISDILKKILEIKEVIDLFVNLTILSEIFKKSKNNMFIAFK